MGRSDAVARRGLPAGALVALLACAALAMAVVLSACGTAAGASGGTAAGASSNVADLDAYPPADMSGFGAFAEAGHDAGSDAQPGAAASCFVDVDVADVARLMEGRQSFALLCAFPGCPWCEGVVGPLGEVAAEKGFKVALLNTRKDPSWKSNLDIEGYDQFVELFGEWLVEDDAGRPHLYVPDLYFVRNGEVVARHEGLLETVDDPKTPLTDEQKADLRSILESGFDSIA